MSHAPLDCIAPPYNGRLEDILCAYCRCGPFAFGYYLQFVLIVHPLRPSCNALICAHREVAAGSARVFRCLAENMNDPDFGATCKYQIRNKLQRRQSNWKLDPPLRKACRADVSSYCADADSKNSEDGLVYKCLIARFGNLASGCQKEVGRAVHMAFFVWAPNAILTSDCDEDINRLCLSQRPNMDQRPGAVGSCLASIVSFRAAWQCKGELFWDKGGSCFDGLAAL